MAAEIINSIKETEKKADKILELSFQEARKVIAEAQEQASEISLKEKEATDKIIVELINDAKVQAEAEANRIREESEKECAGLKERAGKNLDKAAEVVLKRIVSFSGNS